MHARVMAGGQGHEHIASLDWRNDETGATGHSTRAEFVAYIRANGNNSVWCPDRIGGPSAWVHINNNGQVEYVQTFADGRWTNNLLSLPFVA